MKKNGLLSGALSLTLSVLIVKVVGVMYKVPLSYILADEGMGYFNTAYSIYGVFYVISTAGVPRAITCIISETNDPCKGYLIYKHTLRLFTLIGSVLSLLYLFLAPALVGVLGNKNAVLTVMLIGPSILFVSIGGVCRGYLTSNKTLMPIAVSQVLEAISKLVFGIVFAIIGVRLNLSLSTTSALAITGITIGSALSSFTMILYIKIKFKHIISEQNCYIDKLQLNKSLFKIATPVTLGAAVLTFGGVLDVYLIMRSLSAEGLTSAQANELYGNYSTLAVPMINMLVSLVAPLTVAMLPRLIERRISGDKSVFKREVEKNCLITSFFVCPCAAVFFFYSFDVLDVLFTPSQSAKAYQQLATLALGALFLCVLNVLNTTHEALGNFYVPIISSAVGVASKVVISFLLIKWTGLGINLIPLSTVASYFISFAISKSVLHKCSVKVSSVKTIIIPTVLSFVCFGIPYRYVYKEGFLCGGFLSFFTCNLASGFLYFCLAGVIILLTNWQKCKYKQKSSCQK